MQNLVTLVLKIPRNTQTTPEAAQTFLAALTQLNYVAHINKVLGTKPKSFALEIALVNQQIRFQISADKELVPFIETQLQSNYPLVIIEKADDPLENQTLQHICLTLSRGDYYPLANFESFQDIDPMSSVLSVLSKADPNQVTVIQYALESVNPSWQTAGQTFAQQG